VILTDVLALLALIAAIVAAYFGYPAWRESRRRACLDLSIHAVQSTAAVDTEVVQNGNQNQVVFGIVLDNKGDREARFWRLSILSPDQHTMVYLGSGPDRTGRIFKDPRFYDGRWITEALTQNPADRVLPGVPLRLGDRFTLNFPDPCLPRIEAEYWLDADGAQTVAGILVFDFDWTKRTVRLSVGLPRRGRGQIMDASKPRGK
jgi:hypothetical protein